MTYDLIAFLKLSFVVVRIAMVVNSSSKVLQAQNGQGAEERDLWSAHCSWHPLPVKIAKINWSYCGCQRRKQFTGHWADDLEWDL